MSTRINWIVPCYFNTDDGSDEEISFDLTDSLVQVVQNGSWNSQLILGAKKYLEEVNPEDIVKAKVIVKPRFISGIVDPQRLTKFVDKHTNGIHSHFGINSYKNWPYNIGVCVIEVELSYSTPEIPTKKEYLEQRFSKAFLYTFHRHKFLLRELATLFITGLHLTYPTRSIMMWYDTPLSDGLYSSFSGRKKHISQLHTDMFMHHVLIEKSRMKSVHLNISSLSSVWHLNLWALKRFLLAVKSNLVDMDNLLDLIYCLEGLFKKNTSAEFIKLFCVLSICKCKKEAQDMDQLLDLAFKIRNEIAHGGSYYNGFEGLKINGKDVLAETVYWKMKTLTVRMLLKAISKLIKTPKMKSLNFAKEDLYNLIYK